MFREREPTLRVRIVRVERAFAKDVLFRHHIEGVTQTLLGERPLKMFSTEHVLVAVLTQSKCIVA